MERERPRGGSRRQPAPREASIAGIAEGSATVTVTATLPDGTELSDSMLLASCTWLPKAYPASVSAPGGASLTRGATGDASRDYVRCTAPAGQQLEVVGTCGEGFFRVRLPEEFEFSDPDGHSSNRNAFCRRSALSVSAVSVTVSPKSIRARSAS